MKQLFNFPKRLALVFALTAGIAWGFSVKPLQAQKVSLEKAQKVALKQAKAMKKGHVKRAPGLKAEKKAAVKKAAGKGRTRAAAATTVTDEPLYYVFDAGDDGGFVIVSADERAVPVLGYSDRGAYDPNNLPPNFEAWMEGIASEIASAIDNNVSPSAQTQAQWAEYLSEAPLAASGTGEPLLYANTAYTPGNYMVTTTWDQSYTTYTPNNWYTGCVATSAAQVMNYYQHPAGLSADIPQWSYGGYTVGPVPAANKSYTWPMSPSATTGTNSLARLMADIGVAVKMQYTQSGSGATAGDLARALVSYFGYDQSIRYEVRTPSSSPSLAFSDAEWNDLLRKEIDDKRPVLYGASDASAGGHEWVCDGYKTDGTFHFNWGWGGAADGWFSTSATGLNPKPSNTQYSFQKNQVILAGVRPDKGGGALLLSESLSLSGATSGEVYKDQSISLSGKVAAVSPLGYSFSGKIAGALVDDYDNVKAVFGATTASINLGYSAPIVLNGTIPSSVAKGTYKICFVATTKASPALENWIPIDARKAQTDRLPLTVKLRAPNNSAKTGITVTYDGSTFDVANLFNIDGNAGTRHFTPEGATNAAGSLNGSTLNFTKAGGTIKIGLTTDATGIYDAGAKVTATLTVNKGAGTGSVTMANYKFGATPSDPVATGGKTSNPTFKYKGRGATNYSESTNKPTAVGTYTVSATFAANDLWSAHTATANFDVLSAEASISPQDKTVTYNGSAIDVSTLFTISGGGAPSYTLDLTGQTGAGTLSATTQLTVSKAGTFKINVTTAANGTYQAASASAILTVNKGTGKGSVTMDDWRYGETAKEPIASSATNPTNNVSFWYRGVSHIGNQIYGSGEKPSNVGRYFVEATFAETDLWNALTVSDAFDIGLGHISLTPKPATIEYDGSAYDLSQLFTIDANAGAATYTIDASSNGAGSINGTTLTITKPGDIVVNLVTAEGNYEAGSAQSKLTVTRPAAFAVTSNADGAPTDKGTLRWAITCANALEGHDWIDFFNSSGTIAITSDLPLITESVSINGLGATLMGQGAAYRSLWAKGSATDLKVYYMKFSNTQVVNEGGIVRYLSCIFADCPGGAIWTCGGIMALAGCTFTNNSSPEYGGAIYTYGTELRLKGNIFWGNTAPKFPVICNYDDWGSITSYGGNVCDVPSGKGKLNDQTTDDEQLAGFDFVGSDVFANTAPIETQLFTLTNNSPAIGIVANPKDDNTFGLYPVNDFYGKKLPDTDGAAGAVQVMPVATVTTGDDAGAGSLRAALEAVNAGTSLRVVIDPSVDTITITQVLPKISRSVLIDGNGAVLTQKGLNPTGASHLIWIEASLGAPSIININRLMFKGGRSTGKAGAILAGHSTLTLESCIFDDNSGSHGGAIYGWGTDVYLNISGCTFTNNSAEYGGAIYNGSSVTTLKGNVFWGNTATNGSVVELGGSDISKYFATSLGGNIVDKPTGKTAEQGALTAGFDFVAGDVFVSSAPINLKTFKIVASAKAAQAVADASNDYPKFDFYGDAIPAANAAAGAVQAVSRVTVTFEANGGAPVPVPQTLNEGETLQQPAEPTRSEYLFGGWFTNQNLNAASQYVFGAPVTADLTLYAKWNEKAKPMFIVTFKSEGAEYLSQKVESGQKATAPTVPARTGYTFDGWLQCPDASCSSSTAFDFDNTPVTADLTLYAKWTVRQYTITFETGGGSAVNSITADYGSAVNKPADPTREAYTFAGWYTSANFSEAYSFSTMPAENIVLYAKWAPVDVISYTVTFDNEGSISQQVVVMGEHAVAPVAPTREGYRFDGWYVCGDVACNVSTLWDFASPITEDITLTARWTVRQYTITFETGGGSAVAPITADYGSAVSAPAAPTLADNTFAGWFTDAAFTSSYVFGTMPAANITLYAKWIPATATVFTVTFKGEGLADIVQSVESGQTVTAPADPVRNGYVFLGWFEESAAIAYNFATPVTANVTLVARWRDASVPIYTVTFDAKGGAPVPATQVVEAGAKATAPTEEPTREGYTFEGWYKDEGCTQLFDFSTEILNNNITLYAKWTAVPPTGIDDVEKVHAPSLQAYPNPTRGELRIRNYELRAGDAIEVFTAAGQRVAIFTATGEETLINIENLAAGIYVIRVKGETVKIVISE